MGDKRKTKMSYKRANYVSEKKIGAVDKRQKKPGSRKRGNGRGTVERTKNKLNPFKAKVPVEVYIDKKGKPQVRYKSIGSFPTKGLADEALAEYNRTPYDLSSKISTFQDLYKACLRSILKHFQATVPLEQLLRHMHIVAAFII